MDTSNYVQAIYSFKGTNNDELCFKKGQIISITQREEGGWWEGTLDDKTGWFPSNYVTEYKIQSNNGEVVCNSGTTSPNQLPLPVDLTAQQRLYRGVVVKDLLESEKAHVAELKALVVNFLRPLKSSDILTPEEYARLVGNIEDVLAQHSNLVTAMEEGGAEGGEGVRVGKLFLTSAPAVGECVTNYCANHPLAVATLETRREVLGSYMESRGAHPPGLLVLTAGLSKPFRRLDKYQGLLQEVLRHLSETDPDRGDTQRAVTVYKEMAANCNTARRQKQLQLEVLSGGVRGWEGEEVSTLGEILHMGSVAVGPSHSDRYLVLFPRTLLVLAVSARMSGFIYQGKLPLSAIQVKKLEDSEVYKNAFEISGIVLHIGPLIETIVAACQTREDQVKWLELIQKQSVLVLQTSSTTSTLAHKEKSLLGSTHQQAVSTMAVVPHHSTNRITSPISHTQSNISVSSPLTEPTQYYFPYQYLTEYFAHLIASGIITHKLLKLILYPQYLSPPNPNYPPPKLRIHKNEVKLALRDKMYESKWQRNVTLALEIVPNNSMSKKHRSDTPAHFEQVISPLANIKKLQWVVNEGEIPMSRINQKVCDNCLTSNSSCETADWVQMCRQRNASPSDDDTNRQLSYVVKNRPYSAQHFAHSSFHVSSNNSCYSLPALYSHSLSIEQQENLSESSLLSSACIDLSSIQDFNQSQSHNAKLQKYGSMSKPINTSSSNENFALSDKDLEHKMDNAAMRRKRWLQYHSKCYKQESSCSQTMEEDVGGKYESHDNKKASSLDSASIDRYLGSCQQNTKKLRDCNTLALPSLDSQNSSLLSRQATVISVGSDKQHGKFQDSQCQSEENQKMSTVKTQLRPSYSLDVPSSRKNSSESDSAMNKLLHVNSVRKSRESPQASPPHYVSYLVKHIDDARMKRESQRLPPVEEHPYADRHSQHSSSDSGLAISPTPYPSCSCSHTAPSFTNLNTQCCFTCSSANRSQTTLCASKSCSCLRPCNANFCTDLDDFKSNTSSQPPHPSISSVQNSELLTNNLSEINQQMTEQYYCSGLYAHWWLKARLNRVCGHRREPPPPPTSSPPPARAVSVGSTPTKAAQQQHQQPSPPPHQVAQKPSPHRGLSTPLLGGWSLSCLRPAPPLKAGLGIGSLVQDQNNQTRGNRRRDERSFEEDAQILGVIEAYCLSSKTRHTLNSSK
ncbi:hypothetical protein B566_EDAN001219 [Ephemera danica]|nr:hypothetical protein B566_EDAN001219 [Ephemera danica]